MKLAQVPSESRAEERALQRQRGSRPAAVTQAPVGRVQATLDMLGIPYTGSGHLASAIAMDKTRSKQFMDSCGIPTARSLLL